jgi:hypothetical protein
MEDKMAAFENDFPRLEMVLLWLATFIKRWEKVPRGPVAEMS